MENTLPILTTLTLTCAIIYSVYAHFFEAIKSLPKTTKIETETTITKKTKKSAILHDLDDDDELLETNTNRNTNTNRII